jgi:hypothetical protein
MRTTHRPRREVAPATLTLLTPLFRYSSSRDAYVMRGVGNRMGPVLRPRPSALHHPDRPQPDHADG